MVGEGNEGEEASLLLGLLYRRLRELGMWRHVRAVRMAAHRAELLTDNGEALIAELLATARFCLDTGAGGILHPRQSSLREVSTVDSLHLSVDRQGVVTAHIDGVSPVIGREPGGRCRYGLAQVTAHVRREVLPLALSLARPRLLQSPAPAGQVDRSDIRKTNLGGKEVP